ncbi:unnamed protein product, partial [Didymodactylos carnosus]
WFIMKDTYLTYINPSTYEIRFPMLVDRAFEFETGLKHTGTQHGIKVTNLQRSLVVKLSKIWLKKKSSQIYSSRFVFLHRLVDLGEENVRTLKSPAEIAAENLGSKKEPVEASKKIITEMAEDAGVTQSLGSEEMGANTGPRNKFEYEHPVDRKYAEANIRESIKDNIRQVENNKIDEKSSLLRIINNDKYDTISSTSHTSQSQPENKRLMSEKLLKFYRQQIHCACTLATVEIV